MYKTDKILSQLEQNDTTSTRFSNPLHQLIKALIKYKSYFYQIL